MQLSSRSIRCENWGRASYFELGGPGQSTMNTPDISSGRNGTLPHRSVINANGVDFGCR